MLSPLPPRSPVPTAPLSPCFGLGLLLLLTAFTPGSASAVALSLNGHPAQGSDRPRPAQGSPFAALPASPKAEGAGLESPSVRPLPQKGALPEPTSLAQGTPPLPRTDGVSPSLAPPPEQGPLPVLPSPEELLGPDLTPRPPVPVLPLEGETLTVQRFEVLYSTVFSPQDFAAITANYVNRPITFAEVLAVRDAISQLYAKKGYITSGAIVPPQSLQNGVVQIHVVEGSVEAIVVEGTRRLQPSYVSSRLSLGTGTPLNVNRLLQQLQLLRLNPLINNISADLQAGTRPGTNRLVVSVVEADSFDGRYTFDNRRSPSVGSLRHRLQLNERNLTGWGDAITLGYTRTEGSQTFDLGYTLPINARNGTLGITLGNTDSNVIESPFQVLDISSEANVVELTLRQPLIQTPTQEFALGLIASHQDTQTFLGIAGIGGFPLSAGADDRGRTTITALRFFQEWTQRSPQQVIALRSQFNLGIDALGSTVNAGADVPDGRFFSWLGQGQWVRLLAADTLLVVKGSVQLTPDPLLGLERYALGGQSNVRGYRQDGLLTDNGVALSIEGRIPVWRDRDNDTLLQLTPFLEGGYGWNNREADPQDNTLLGVGVGMLLQVENFDLRLDWGIPLLTRSGDGTSLQERGVYFSVGYSFF